MPMRWRCPPENSGGLAVERRARQADPVDELGGLVALRPFATSRRAPAIGSATISCAVRCGSSEPYGSWKTICTRWRIGRSCRSVSVARSVPSRSMPPEVGLSSRTSALAMVDLPQPDSPTMARVPPRGTVKQTSSTARKTSLPVPVLDDEVARR